MALAIGPGCSWGPRREVQKRCRFQRACLSAAVRFGALYRALFLGQRQFAAILALDGDPACLTAKLQALELSPAACTLPPSEEQLVRVFPRGRRISAPVRLSMRRARRACVGCWLSGSVQDRHRPALSVLLYVTVVFVGKVVQSTRSCPRKVVSTPCHWTSTGKSCLPTWRLECSANAGVTVGSNGFARHGASSTAVGIPVPSLTRAR